MTSFDHLRELRQWLHPLFTDMEAEAEREAIYPNSSGKKVGTWDLNLILETPGQFLSSVPQASLIHLPPRLSVKGGLALPSLDLKRNNTLVVVIILWLPT